MEGKKGAFAPEKTLASRLKTVFMGGAGEKSASSRERPDDLAMREVRRKGRKGTTPKKGWSSLRRSRSALEEEKGPHLSRRRGKKWFRY